MLSMMIFAPQGLESHSHGKLCLIKPLLSGEEYLFLLKEYLYSSWRLIKFLNIYKWLLLLFDI